MSDTVVQTFLSARRPGRQECLPHQEKQLLGVYQSETMRPPSRWLLAITWAACAVLWVEYLFVIGVFYYVQPWTFRTEERLFDVFIVLGPSVFATLSVFFSRSSRIAVAWVLGVLLLMALIGLLAPTWHAYRAMQYGPDTEELPRSTLVGTTIGVYIALVFHYPLALFTAAYSFVAIQLRWIVDRKVIRSRMADAPEPPPQ